MLIPDIRSFNTEMDENSNFWSDVFHETNTWKCKYLMGVFPQKDCWKWKRADEGYDNKQMKENANMCWEFLQLTDSRGKC